VARSPRLNCVDSTSASAAASDGGTRVAAARHAVRATSSSASRRRSVVIAGQARRSPSLDRVCSAWARAGGNTDVNSRRTRSSVRDVSCWIRAQVIMSRT